MLFAIPRNPVRRLLHRIGAALMFMSVKSYRYTGPTFKDLRHREKELAMWKAKQESVLGLDRRNSYNGTDRREADV